MVTNLLTGVSIKSIKRHKYGTDMGHHETWTSIHTVLLEPIGRDRRDLIGFSITETELTILESALGVGHGGGASASTPLQL